MGHPMGGNDKRRSRWRSPVSMRGLRMESLVVSAMSAGSFAMALVECSRQLVPGGYRELLDVPRRLELLVLDPGNFVCTEDVHGWCKPSLCDDRRNDGRSDDGSDEDRELLLIDDARIQTVER